MGREEEEGEREEEEGKEHIGFCILHYSKLIPPSPFGVLTMVVPVCLLVHGDKRKKGAGRAEGRGGSITV